MRVEFLSFAPIAFVYSYIFAKQQRKKWQSDQERAKKKNGTKWAAIMNEVPFDIERKYE